MAINYEELGKRLGYLHKAQDEFFEDLKRHLPVPRVSDQIMALAGARAPWFNAALWASENLAERLQMLETPGEMIRRATLIGEQVEHFTFAVLDLSQEMGLSFFETLPLVVPRRYINMAAIPPEASPIFQ
jgi:hypothetical protein